MPSSDITHAFDSIRYPDFVVSPEYIDPNGHMNVGYYAVLFDKALDLPWDQLGLGPASIEATGCSSFTLESHITYQHELPRTLPMIRPITIAAVVLAALTSCGQAPAPSPTVTRKVDLQQIAKNARRPDLTSEKIAGDIVGRKLSIPELHGDGADELWVFDASEFIHVNIQEDTVTTTGGETLVVFVTTRSDPKPDKSQIYVAGKLELQYEWKADKWVLATIRNLTARYTITRNTGG